jgi:hypothetical protein
LYLLLLSLGCFSFPRSVASTSSQLHKASWPAYSFPCPSALIHPHIWIINTCLVFHQNALHLFSSISASPKCQYGLSLVFSGQSLPLPHTVPHCRWNNIPKILI